MREQHEYTRIQHEAFIERKHLPEKTFVMNYETMESKILAIDEENFILKEELNDLK